MMMMMQPLHVRRLVFRRAPRRGDAMYYAVDRPTAPPPTTLASNPRRRRAISRRSPDSPRSPTRPSPATRAISLAGARSSTYHGVSVVSLPRAPPLDAPHAPSRASTPPPTTNEDSARGGTARSSCACTAARPRRPPRTAGTPARRPRRSALQGRPAGWRHAFGRRRFCFSHDDPRTHSGRSARWGRGRRRLGAPRP